MKLRSILEGRNDLSSYEFPVEVPVDPNNEDTDYREVEGRIMYNWSTPMAATREQPAEGGVEVEYIEIDGKPAYNDEDLEALGVDASFEGLIDQYIDRIYDREREYAEASRYGGYDY